MTHSLPKEETCCAWFPTKGGDMLRMAGDPFPTKGGDMLRMVGDPFPTKGGDMLRMVGEFPHATHSYQRRRHMVSDPGTEIVIKTDINVKYISIYIIDRYKKFLFLIRFLLGVNDEA